MSGRMRAKIIATIGPASRGVKRVGELIAAGMDVARLNMAHSEEAAIKRDIAAIREASRKAGRPVAIMADLAGPKIRTGPLTADKIKLTAGSEFALTTEPGPGTSALVSVSYSGLPADVSPGQLILLADGLIALRVARVETAKIICRVETGGVLRAHQGINLPEATISTPTITEKDEDNLALCLALGVDLVALSFVRRGRDIIDLKRLIREAGKRCPVVAKIEKHESVGRLDEIIEAADGVMIARGDLGVEVPTEEVPILQKEIIKRAQKRGKASIVATQMLESMIRSPRPTRAEASDVANAVFDGADAVMLSGETAVGKHPDLVVATMSRIIERAEANIDYDAALQARSHWASETVSDAISYATCQLASVLAAKAIITSTETGRTAKEVSRYRPAAPVVAVSPNEETVRQLKLWWGVEPVLTEVSATIDDMLKTALREIKSHALAVTGDQVVITAGTLVNVPGTTNLIKVETV